MELTIDKTGSDMVMINNCISCVMSNQRPYYRIFWLRYGTLNVITTWGIVYTFNVNVSNCYNMIWTDRDGCSYTDEMVKYIVDEPDVAERAGREVMEINRLCGLSLPLLYAKDNFQAESIMEETLKSKTYMGSHRVIIEDTFQKDYPIGLLLFKGIFGLNKGDQLDIAVYDMNMVPGYPPNAILCRFKVHKKKLKGTFDIAFVAINLFKHP